MQLECSIAVMDSGSDFTGTIAKLLLDSLLFEATRKSLSDSERLVLDRCDKADRSFAMRILVSNFFRLLRFWSKAQGLESRLFCALKDSDQLIQLVLGRPYLICSS